MYLPKNLTLNNIAALELPKVASVEGMREALYEAYTLSLEYNVHGGTPPEIATSAAQLNGAMAKARYVADELERLASTIRETVA